MHVPSHTGLLAIWSDVDADQQTDYLHWLSREHVLERIGVDGFLAGRVFRCVEQNRCHYFIAYELTDPSVLVGPSYLARLNAPTPWSTRIMPILRNFARGGGAIVARAGLGRGGVVAPLRFAWSDAPGLAAPEAPDVLVRRLAALDGVCAAWLMRVDQAATSVPTKEKGLRGNEGAFDALLVVEGLHDGAVQAAVEQVLQPGVFAAGAVTQTTRFTACFALDRRLAGLPPAQ